MFNLLILDFCFFDFILNNWLSALITVSQHSVNTDAQMFISSIYLYIFFSPTDPLPSTLRFLIFPIHHCDVYPLIKRRCVSDKSARPNWTAVLFFLRCHNSLRRVTGVPAMSSAGRSRQPKLLWEQKGRQKKGRGKKKKLVQSLFTSERGDSALTREMRLGNWGGWRVHGALAGSRQKNQTRAALRVCRGSG